MDETASLLDQITTRWPSITDPLRFVLRYAPAIRRYLSVIVRDPHELEDVIQSFLLRVVEKGFSEGQVSTGRFRDYLKACVRNAALAHLRKKRPGMASEAQLASLAAPDQGGREWDEEWRSTMLASAFEKLEEHERHAPDGRLHTVLCLARDHADADSPTLAELAAKRSGKPMTPEGFRKQLSRARAMLADLLADEARRTLDDPSPERVEEELAAVGLLEQVRSYREKG